MDISEQMGEPCWQNKRLSSVFKREEPYYIQAILWKDEKGGTFTGRVDGVNSSQFIKFPFTPKTFYIDVIEKDLPSDWEEEPFYEENERKFRYEIKDKSQLEKVFKIYVRES